MERGPAAAGGLGLRQPSAAFEAPGIKQSGRGLPHSKAAAPQSADGLPPTELSPHCVNWLR
jgi:hypothetical protein